MGWDGQPLTRSHFGCDISAGVGDPLPQCRTHDLQVAGLQPAAACSALDRIRLELAGRLSTSDLPGFTVSYGLVAAGRCGSLEEAIRRADDALYEAKAKGRDCSVIADEADDDTDQPYVSSIRMAERAEPREEGVLAGLSQFDDPLDI